MTDSSAPVAASLSPMQQALLDRADSIFTSIGSAVSKASDLALQGGKAVADQIPDVAYQYVAYGRALETVYMLLAIIGFVVALWIIINIFIIDEWDFGSDGTIIFGGGSGIILCIASIITFFSQLSDFIMVWFAPKIWLLQELTTLIKSLHN